ncbi:hypothetical protein [Isoptericola aurantiacus]|uniref:hypothetical protein n=1 Tax=Isoptericola aurantiacus TaxID=3377839 RepID=UPI00383A8520
MNKPTFDDVAKALEQNLRDTTGDCICDEAYAGRGMADPHCGWHNAAGTADYDSVRRVLALFEPETVTTAAGVRAAAQALEEVEHNIRWGDYWVEGARRFGAHVQEVANPDSKPYPTFRSVPIADWLYRHANRIENGETP